MKPLEIACRNVTTVSGQPKNCAAEAGEYCTFYTPFGGAIVESNEFHPERIEDAAAASLPASASIATAGDVDKAFEMVVDELV